jgi:hypothetical protein
MSTCVPCPSTSKHRMPIAMTESVISNSCRIQSGVNVHEDQVFRGYIMSGATIHDAQLWRARVIAVGLFVVGFSIVDDLSIVLSLLIS